MTNPAENPTPNDPQEADELLSAYLDGELAGEELATVEQRLAEDPEARATLDAMRGLSSTLKSLPRATLDGSFTEVVQARVEAEAPATGERAAIIDCHPDEPRGVAWSDWARSPRRWVYAGMAVAAALLVMVLSPESPNKVPGELAKLDAAAADPPARLEMEAAPAAESIAESMPAIESMDDTAEVGGAPSSPPWSSSRMGRAAATEEMAEGLAEFDSGVAGAAAPRLDAMRRAEAPSEDRLAIAAEQVREEPGSPPVIVVRVQLRPEAYREQLVNRVLATQGIAVEAEPRRQSLALADGADSAATRGGILSNAISVLPTNELGPRAAELAASEAPNAEVLVLDAPAAQFAAALDELRNDFANCNALTVCPSPAPASGAEATSTGSGRSSGEDWLYFNRLGGLSEASPELAKFKKKVLVGKIQAQAFQLAAEDVKTLQTLPAQEAVAPGEAPGGGGGRARESHLATTERAALSQAPVTDGLRQRLTQTDPSQRVQALVIVEPDPAPPSKTDAAE